MMLKNKAISLWNNLLVALELTQCVFAFYDETVNDTYNYVINNISTKKYEIDLNYRRLIMNVDEDNSIHIRSLTGGWVGDRYGVPVFRWTSKRPSFATLYKYLVMLKSMQVAIKEHDKKTVKNAVKDILSR